MSILKEMGAFMAIYYWNTAERVLPITRPVDNDVEVSVPSQQLNELVIMDLIEEEEVQPASDYSTGYCK